jgi:hypothetical protein
MKTQIPCPYTRAIEAGTIPLGKATPGCGTEDPNAHSSSVLIELGVRVGADLAIQTDFFVLRRCPFHGRCLPFPNGGMQQHQKNIMQCGKKTTSKY